jgi:transposase
MTPETLGSLSGSVPGLGLPRLSAWDRQSAWRIWLAVAPADMRWGFDRLAELAGAVTGQDPLGGQVFLFRSRGGDRLKMLLWEGDGYLLWYKRLEEGTFRFPKVAPGTASLTLRPSELAMLLEGIDLSSVKRGKRYRRPAPAPGAPKTGKPGG